MRIISMNKIVATCLAILRSRKFFLVIVGLLVLQAGWLALTARYPMAFDENFHFGIIKLYAGQWSPFFTHEPANSAAYGDLERSASYLYQYLMSFPYRLIALFVHQEAVQVIILRFINIGLFSAGLFMFRKVLLRLRISPAVTNLSLLMLVLIPVVPFLAGQINYDNLVFLLIPIVTLLTLSCSEGMRKTGSMPPVSLALLLIVCLLTSLVKYAFLPIFVALAIYLVIVVLVHKQRKTAVRQTVRSFWSLRVWIKISLIVGLIVAGGLFAERYGINIVRYHSLQPDCAVLRSVDECVQYGPWARNATVKAENIAAGGVPLDPALPLFLPAWVVGMMHRLYFAINYDYLNYFELPIITDTAYIVGFVGLLLLVGYGFWLFRRRPQLLLVALIIVVYVASLLYVNFTGYIHYRTMQAINGRYLILILPFFFALIATCYSHFFDQLASKRAQLYKVGVTAIVIILTLQGAGLLTYIVRSDEAWWWPNQTVISVNAAAKQALTPLIIGAGERIISN